MKKRYKVILLVMILFLGFTAFPHAAHPGEDEPGLIEKFLSGVVRSLAYGGEKFLKNTGLTVDKIILGDDVSDVQSEVDLEEILENNENISELMRVAKELKGRYGWSDNPFHFTVDESSPYGYTLLLLHRLLVKGIIPWMLSVLVLAGMKLWFKNSRDNQINLKNIMSTYTVSLILVIHLPRTVNLFNSAFLHLARLFGSIGGMDFLEVFSIRAYETKRLFDAILYLGGVGLQLWFAVIYTYRIGSLLFMIGLGLVMIMMMNSRITKNSFFEWLKEIISLITMPFIDSFLLFIVSLIIVLGALPGFISLVLAMCIIPTRAKIRSWFGLSKGGLSEYAGFAGMMGMASLAIGMARGIGKGGSQFSEGFNEWKEGRNANEEIANEISNISGGGGSGLGGGNLSLTPPGHQEISTPNEVLLGGSDEESIVSQYEANKVGPVGISSHALSGPTETNKIVDFDHMKREKDRAIQLQKQGSAKMKRAVGGAVGGALGGLAGASLFSLQGVAAASYAGKTGGALGNMIGQTAAYIPTVAGDEWEYFRRRWNNENDAVDSESSTVLDIDADEEESYLPAEAVDVSVSTPDSQYRDHYERIPENESYDELGQNFNNPLPKAANAYNIRMDYEKMFNRDELNAIATAAHQVTVKETGIDAYAIQQNFQDKKQQEFELRVSNLTSSGVTVNEEMKSEIASELDDKYFDQYNAHPDIQKYNEVCDKNFDMIAVTAAYDRFQREGYSSSSLDGYQSELKAKIAEIAKQDLNNRLNDAPLKKVDDI